MPARIRIPAWAVWEVATFVLNVLAFILVGFQLRAISARLTGATGARYVGIAVAVTLAVILARLAWVSAAAVVIRWRGRAQDGRTSLPRDAEALTPRGAALIGWSGMRGTVTLATALALPSDFPYRDLILTTAFGVTLGTLVLQGLTLRPLLLRLGLEDDGSVDREVRLARVETLRAAVAAAAGCPGGEGTQMVRHRYALQLRRAEAAQAGEVQADAAASATRSSGGHDDDAVAVRVAMAAERQRLLALRDDGTIGDAAFQRLEEELDWTELGWAQVVGTGGRSTAHESRESVRSQSG
jgi:CPA1 family monovalent cation:H+ antiporter